MEHVLNPVALHRVTDREVSLSGTIRAVAAGDRDAFSQLYADYSRMVHAVLLGRVPRRDVDDLVQDVFVTAYTRIRELREPAAFGGGSPRSPATGRRTTCARAASRWSCPTNCRAAIPSRPK